MPQVGGTDIKSRAASLRAAGTKQVTKHLTAQVGQTHSVLTENPHMGRTEQFTEVAFKAPQPIGKIVTAAITGHSDIQLTA